MTDFSVEAQRIVEAVQIACVEITDAAKKSYAGDVPTPFQRAVIGGLVLIAHAALPAPLPTDAALFTEQEIGAASRAIAPFLDETPRPA